MQFLSDVYLRCPDCDGKRYRAETLEIRREGADGTRKNIADVLDMTVTEALAFFRDNSNVAVRLQPLVDVGLEYVKLGQPVPTLSGGEAQRLKLAGHLAEAAADDTPSIRGKLFLFDEPTTGLHFDDVAKLLRAFRKLLKIGHSLLVIEHNLDVIRAADWLIDLGPEGGDARRRDRGRRARPRRSKRIRPRTPARRCANTKRAIGSAAELRSRRARCAETAGAIRRPATPSSSTTRANITCATSTSTIPREAFTVITGVVGLGQIHAGLRHHLQRRPAPLSRIAERLRAPVRAAGGAARRRRHLRHSAHGGHRAAHQPRRPQEHGGHAHRDLSLPAPAVS